ncbi:MAG: diguanylate cyclase [Kangiellaceae bacterium]|nr:diguanylate cyclase [Kangiellaceae bacterium]MCW8998760.1 diguanylate cyclase [Kangiellaceae bacterium]
MERLLFKILIVDDTPQNIDVLHQMLTHRNYSVAGVPSGKVALEIASEFKPDLILLDVMMPEMDGFETCRKLKSDPETADIPVIFVTAKDDPQDIAEGFRCGGVDYIIKPAKEEEVWARVGHQIKLRQLIENKNLLISMLKHMEQRNREIITRASDPMLIVNNQGQIESTNPAATHLLGYAESELVDKPFDVILKPEDIGLYRSCFHSKTVSEANDQPLTRIGAKELYVVRNDGVSVPVDLSISQVGYEAPLFLCLIHDLTLHKNLISELKQLSLIDKLTNLANRRRFDEYIQLEWGRCIRAQHSICALFIDIDFFKLYNDTYGHPKGDSCLQAVAKVLTDFISRPSDLIARYGGEEFIAILPETSFQGAVDLAEKIRHKVESLLIEHKASRVNKSVTVSIGVGCCTPQANDSYQVLVRKTDELLYKAKENGRNRTEAAEIKI